MLVLDGVRRGSNQPLNLAPLGEAAVGVLPSPALMPGRSLDGLRRKVQQPEAVTRVAEAFVPEQEAGRRFNWYPVAAVSVLAPALALTVYGAVTIPRPAIQRVATALPAVAQPAPEAPKTPEVSAIQLQLQQLLNDFGANETASFGVVVKNLQTGDTATLNPEKIYTSASFYKLFVANQFYLAAENGEIAPTPANLNCLRVMINISSNDCGSTLGEKLGWGRQDASLKAQGYTGTSLASLQKTTAQDVALLLERIYKKEGIAPEHADQFMQYLREQRIVNRLPQGLPAGTEIAHKTGDLFGYVHDGGIVFSPKGDYIVVGMSGPWSKPGAAPARFAELSAKVFAIINQ